PTAKTRCLSCRVAHRMSGRRLGDSAARRLGDSATWATRELGDANDARHPDSNSRSSSYSTRSASLRCTSIAQAASISELSTTLESDLTSSFEHLARYAVIIDNRSVIALTEPQIWTIIGVV